MLMSEYYECRSEKLGLPQLIQTSSLSITVIDQTLDPTKVSMFSEKGDGVFVR